MRANRKGIPDISAATKNLKRGNSLFYQHAEHAIHFLVWKDVKLIRMLSTLEAPISVTQNCKRWTGKKGEKTHQAYPIPDQVVHYNSAMGGTDVSDAVTKRNKRTVRTSRWTVKVFTYLLDKTLCNSWLLWRESIDVNTSFDTFKEAVITGLLGRQANIRLMSSGTRTPCKADHEDRLDSTFRHFVVKATQRTCYVHRTCSDKAKSTIYACYHCGVNLCPDRCFFMYHSEQELLDPEHYSVPAGPRSPSSDTSPRAKKARRALF